MSKPKWAETLEWIAHGLDIQKGMPHISEQHLEAFISALRRIAAMNLGPLEASGVCETCESEAVKRAETAERKLRLATRLLEAERKTRSANTTDAELAANLLAEVEARERAEFERNEWESLSTGWMNKCNDLIGRVDELESALRKANKSRPAISGVDAISRDGPRECHDCACNWTAEDRTECAETGPCDVYDQRASDTKCTICGTRKAVIDTGGWDCPRCTTLGITRANDTRCLTCGTGKAIIATGQWACPRCSGAWDSQ